MREAPDLDSSWDDFWSEYIVVLIESKPQAGCGGDPVSKKPLKKKKESKPQKRISVLN